MKTSIFITATDAEGRGASMHVMTEKQWVMDEAVFTDGALTRPAKTFLATTFLPSKLNKLYIRDEIGNVFTFVPE